MRKRLFGLAVLSISLIVVITLSTFNNSVFSSSPACKKSPCCSCKSSPTPTRTSTPTQTITQGTIGITFTPMRTPTPTPTPTISVRPSFLPTRSPTPTITITPAPTLLPTPTKTPIPLITPTPGQLITSIFSGLYSSIAIYNNGSVKAWGYNFAGQLGFGDDYIRNIPALVPWLTNVKQVAMGENFTLFLMKDGTVKTCGRNEYGQLGLGDDINRVIPTSVPGLTGVQQVVAGEFSALALMSNGTVKSWGSNAVGMLGLGDVTSIPNSLVPITIPWLTNVKQLTANLNQCFAVLDDGTVKGWGWNTYGQLGTGDVSEIVVYPSIIIGLAGVNQLFAGNGFTFAIMNKGTVKAWGLNDWGQLGLGHRTDINVPLTIVPGLKGSRQLALGLDYCLALMDDGSVKAWGLNWNGQLGFGNVTEEFKPTTIPGLIGVKQLAAGASHNLALMSNGTVKVWGYNAQGQLGMEDYINRNTPTTNGYLP